MVGDVGTDTIGARFESRTKLSGGPEHWLGTVSGSSPYPQIYHWPKFLKGQRIVRPQTSVWRYEGLAKHFFSTLKIYFSPKTIHEYVEMVYNIIKLYFFVASNVCKKHPFLDCPFLQFLVSTYIGEFVGSNPTQGSSSSFLWKERAVLGVVDFFAFSCLSTSLPSCWDMRVCWGFAL